MNIVYLIGNGFDINLGLKTKYLDFLNYYKSTPSKNDLINQLKLSMEGSIEDWSDMELAFGRYTNNLKDEIEFSIVYDDLEDSLANYLDEAEKEFDVNSIDRLEFYHQLTFPEEFLRPADKNKLQAYKQNWQRNEWDISIITFNYTRVLEKILENENERLILTTRNLDTFLNPVIHIHGYTDERMILGVNDKSQILNEKFHDNLDIIETLVKISCNQVQKHLIDETCTKLIEKADLICIFGSSIGKTDKFWWELVGKRLFKDCKVIIFVKDGSIHKRRQQKISSIERKNRQNFYLNANIPIEKINLIEDNLFFGIDTGIFKIKIENRWI